MNDPGSGYRLAVILLLSGILAGLFIYLVVLFQWR